MQRAWIATGLAIVVFFVVSLLARDLDESIRAPDGEFADTALPAVLNGASTVRPKEVAVQTPASAWNHEQLSAVLRSDLPLDGDDPALPEGRRIVRVTVVDRLGAPVPGAVLRGAWARWHTKSYRSDREGRATLELPRLDCAVRVVLAPGPRRLRVPYRHPVLRGESTVRIVIPTLRRLSGVVRGVGRDRSPDQVVAYRRPFAAAYEQPDRLPWVVLATDVSEDGSFALDVPDDDDVFLMYVSRNRGFASHAVAATVSPRDADVHLVPEPARKGSLRIRVLASANGRPLESVDVYCTHAWHLGRALHGTTDEDGECVFDDVPESLYVVEVDARKRFGDAFGRVHRLVLVDATTTETIVLPQINTRIRGHVKTSDGQRVCGGVTVFQGGNRISQFTTDGSFDELLPCLPGTIIDVKVEHSFGHLGYHYDHHLGIVQGIAAGGEPVTVVVAKIEALTFEDTQSSREDLMRMAGHFVPIWRKSNRTDQLAWPPRQLDEVVALWRTYIAALAGSIGHRVRVHAATTHFVKALNQMVSADARLMGPTTRCDFTDYFIEGIGFAADVEIDELVKSLRRW